MAVVPPEPLPPLPQSGPIRFPDDPLEQVIFANHLYFFRSQGRWPNGAERARAFNASLNAAFSKARRKETYNRMVEAGIFVFVTFRNGRGDTTCYIMPDQSPEYAGKNGWVFYAPQFGVADASPDAA
jgi:hypothetical protein